MKPLILRGVRVMPRLCALYYGIRLKPE